MPGLPEENKTTFFNFRDDMVWFYGHEKRTLFKDRESSKEPLASFKNDYLPDGA
jgi:hypothetical protein